MKVGIDLGTTYSLAARIDADGAPMLIPDLADQEAFNTPSAVSLGRRTAVVGRAVEALSQQKPEQKVIRLFKRRMGESKPIAYDDDGTPWYPEAVSALVLKKLRFDAESHCSTAVESAVITVPAHFNDPQRKAVVAAAAIADIHLLGLVEEPVAAALHYGVTTCARNQTVLVYDFGGGTFDATVLSMDEKGVRVAAKTGLTDVGGKELDDKLGEMVLAQFRKALRGALTLNSRTALQLRRISESLKIELCTTGVGWVRRNVSLGGEVVQVRVAKGSFDAVISGILDQTEAEMLKCLADAGLSRGDVDVVLMVGGSSLVPAVERRLKAVFDSGRQKVLYHFPSRAVAFGAAIHAAQLSGEAEMFNFPSELRGVTGHNVGVRARDPESGRPTVELLIRKNLPLPQKVQRTYYTASPDQREIVLELVQYRDSPSSAISIGQLAVGPLPSPRQNYPVEVTVENRSDGTIAVQVYDSETREQLSQIFGRVSDSGNGDLLTQRGLVRSTVINNL